MLITDLDYNLPPSLIATRPAEPRDHSRLMVVHRSTGQIDHRHFYDLPEYLRPTDLLIVNDTRVIPAKLNLQKNTGAAIPGLFLAEPQLGQWQVLLRSRGKIKIGDELVPHLKNTAEIAEDAEFYKNKKNSLRPLRSLRCIPYRFRIESRIPNEKGTKGGEWLISVTPPDPAPLILAHIGGIPLPPYIEKSRTADTADRDAYQTVYAREGQSLAAPTAGLHFTPTLLKKIEALGTQRAAVNLDVGLGTFLPVETQTLEEHPMHTEEYSIPAATIAAIRQRSGRIVVVGTTAVRTLEAAADQILHPTPQRDGGGGVATYDIHNSTNLKISPPYQFQLADVLLTNFHLPRSTLLALVAALIGLDKLKELYALAIEKKYRFYSYGDAMLILP